MRLTIKKIVIAVIGVILGGQSFSAAETIYLQSGEKIEGNIIDQTDQYLIVDAPGTSGTYRWKDVKTIEQTPAQLSFLSQNSLTSPAGTADIVVEDVILKESEETAPVKSTESYRGGPAQLSADPVKQSKSQDQSPSLNEKVKALEVRSRIENLQENESSLPQHKQGDKGRRVLTDEQVAQSIFDGAMSFVTKGDVDKAVELLKETIEIQPSRPDWHMNYGVLLLTKANNISKNKKTAQARAFYQEAYKELTLSIDLFDAANEKLKPFISQCYFLLGEMDRYVFGDKTKAKNFYQKALEYSAHEGAQQALVSLMK